ncbi:uncharacterized protein zgc:194655 [Myxocyprinus asiaticus]|uniref:uncharacterized protein zgc:194655 n=1 Tax=Myxocyprinus asiaticus TaxID=70543 RepID=UPI002222C07C|nr:uncharacterized protein zgc:194655 [Myxocyprinus asiaticus]
MIYQVLINFDDKKNKPLEVADCEDKFNKTTVLELKRKFKEKIAGSPDPENLRVIFGKDPLEDNMTLVFYKIKHLSVLFFILKMPGGGDV